MQIYRRGHLREGPEIKLVITKRRSLFRGDAAGAVLEEISVRSLLFLPTSIILCTSKERDELQHSLAM